MDKHRMNGWRNVVYTMEYYSASKREEILSYATTWMKFEDIMSSTISQSHKDKSKTWSHLHELSKSDSSNRKVEWLLPGGRGREAKRSCCSMQETFSFARQKGSRDLLHKVPRVNTSVLYILKMVKMGLPWKYSDKESACQCRGHGFDPWSRKSPHVAGQLGPTTTATEARAP